MKINEFYCTNAHAFNYNTITVYQDGEWSNPFYIKTSIVYNEAYF